MHDGAWFEGVEGSALFADLPGEIIHEIVIFEEPIFRKIMDIQAEKLHLIEELARIQDIHIIEQIKQLLKKAHNPVVGYTANGQSITHRDFIQQIEQAESEHKSGNYQTIDDVEKESESW